MSGNQDSPSLQNESGSHNELGSSVMSPASAIAESQSEAAKRYEKNKTSSERSLDILESISEAFFTLDEDWQFSYANRATGLLLNRDVKDLLGKSIWVEYPGLVKSGFEPIYRKGMIERVELSITEYYPDHKRWYEVNVFPASKGITVYFKDVSERKKAEEEIKKLNERNREILESITDGFFAVDDDWKFTYVNTQAGNILDKIPSELIGRSLWEVYPGLAGTEFERAYLITANDGVTSTFTAYYPDHDRWYEVNSYPASNGITVYFRNVTKRMRTDKQLLASNERYQTLFNSIDEGFCIIEMMFDASGKPVDYRFLEINPAFEKLTGIPADEALTGKPVSQLVPNFEERWYQLYGNVALTGEPVRAVEGSEAMARWFDVNAFRIGGKESRKVAILFNNITERKRAEQEGERLLRQLEAERSKLAYLFTKAPAFVATVSGPEHIFELTNPAYLQLIGHRDVIGKPARKALPEIEGQGFFELLDNVFQTGEAFTGRELSIQIQTEPNGPLEQRFLDFVYQPIFEANGMVSGIFAHGIDITEQVSARRSAEDANRTKDEFLATLSHELRTPLNAILGWSKMMSDSRLDENVQKRALETIQRNARVQSQLIDDILDVSRIISGKLRLEVRPVELSSVIELAVESVLPAAQAKEIRLQRVLDSDSNMISGDPNRLQQVIWNLLYNAVKFTPKGGRVQVRLERTSSHVEIIVTDTGIGISAKVLPFIFDRFRQADSATTRQHGGLGLGLAIVRHLVEMHGGTVEAESEGEGQGSTFTVKLPLIAMRSIDKLPQGEERVHPTSRNNVPFERSSELEGLHVLVVDDEEDGRTLVATVLEQCGARVTEAVSAATAFELIQKLRPDVLISDLGMPGEDGYSLIKKVRALKAEQGGQIPAAALTAYARTEDRMRVLRSGFQIHLPKPVEPAELVAVVGNLAGRHDK